MTAHQKATDAGFNSLQHLVDTVGIPKRTLIDWSIKNPEKFKVVLLGGMVLLGSTKKELERVKDEHC